MVASDVASKHSHIRALEVNKTVLKPFLGDLDFACIHTTVRVAGRHRGVSPMFISKVQRVPESHAGSADTELAGESSVPVGGRHKGRVYLPCPSTKPGSSWPAPHPGSCVTVLREMQSCKPAPVALLGYAPLPPT